MLDEYAYCNGLRNANTKLKAAFALITLTISIFSTSPITPFIIFFIMASLTIFAAKIPARAYFRWFSGPILFMLPVFAAMIFFFGLEPWLSIRLFDYSLAAHKDGFNLGLLAVSRVLGGTSCLFFLAFTTPTMELFSALKYLKIPSIVVELSMLIYRYIFVALEEAVKMHHAQKMRLGYSEFKRSLYSFSLLAGSLFIRAWDRGERLFIAMNSRCYDGRVELLGEDKPISAQRLVVLAAFESTLIAVAYLTRNFTLV